MHPAQVEKGVGHDLLVGSVVKQSGRSCSVSRPCDHISACLPSMAYFLIDTCMVKRQSLWGQCLPLLLSTCGLSAGTVSGLHIHVACGVKRR